MPRRGAFHGTGTRKANRSNLPFFVVDLGQRSMISSASSVFDGQSLDEGRISSSVAWGEGAFEAYR